MSEICPLTRVINLHVTSYIQYPEPLSRVGLSGFFCCFFCINSIFHSSAWVFSQQSWLHLTFCKFGGVWLGWLVAGYVGLVGLMEVHGLKRLIESTSDFRVWILTTSFSRFPTSEDMLIIVSGLEHL